MIELALKVAVFLFLAWLTVILIGLVVSCLGALTKPRTYEPGLVWIEKSQDWWWTDEMTFWCWREWTKEDRERAKRNGEIYRTGRATFSATKFREAREAEKKNRSDLGDVSK